MKSKDEIKFLFRVDNLYLFCRAESPSKLLPVISDYVPSRVVHFIEEGYRIHRVGSLPVLNKDMGTWIFNDWEVDIDKSPEPVCCIYRSRTMEVYNDINTGTVYVETPNGNQVNVSNNLLMSIGLRKDSRAWYYFINYLSSILLED